MKFSCATAGLASAINDVLKAVDKPELIYLNLSDKLYITGTNSGKSVEVCTDVTISKKGKIGVNASILQGILKARKEISLELVDDSKMKFGSPSSKSYSGDFVTVPFEEIEVELKEGEGKSVSFTSEQLTLLNSTVSDVQLQQAYFTDTLPIQITLGAKGTEIMSVDQFHLAYVSDKTTTSKKESTIRLPPNTFALISSTAKNQSYKLVMGDAVVYAYNKQFKYRLPLEQAESEVGEIDIKGAIKAFMADKQTVVEVDKEELTNILDNAMSLYEQGVPIEIKVIKGKLQFKTKTNYGQVVDALKASVEKDSGKTYKCELSILLEIVGKQKGKTLKVHFNDKCVFFSHKNDTQFKFFSGGLLE